ncbi:calcium-binding protein [Streptomyces sp. NPDC001985]|uniref:calcium-binding protein n=1 Tax=Streptomyces sp. NPDC001985 TaxID=3154406 RepID=UPI00331B6E0F
MRTRASVAVVTGAFALSALAVPAAQAADKPDSAAAARAALAAPDVTYGDTKISNVVVNGGKPIVVGISDKTFSVTFTASDNSGIAGADANLWHGSNFDDPDGWISSDGVNGASCGSGTKPTCKVNFTVMPWLDLDTSALRTKWKVSADADGKDGDFTYRDNVKTFDFTHAAKLTVNASPEPVKKGKTITATGTLTRVNWAAEKYSGYGDQSVKLQFKKKGAKTWSTLKTIKSDKKGNLKTTVKASADGSFRYSYAGNSSTQSLNSGEDYVDVR